MGLILRDVPIQWLTIQGGLSPIAEHPAVDFYRAVLTGRPYTDTAYARLMRAYVTARGSIYDCRGLDSLASYLGRRADEFTAPWTPIPTPVHMRYDGKLDLLDMHHRTCRQIAEGRTRITVDVQQVHPLWQQLDDWLAGIYGSRKLYQEIAHPWFDTWELIRPNRLSTIEDYLTVAISKGRLVVGEIALDIGCLTGGISRVFSGLGFHAFGVDCDPLILRIAGYLSLVFGQKATYYQHNVLSGAAPWESSWFYGPVSCLSLFHHFLKDHVDVIERMLGHFARKARMVLLDLPGPADTWVKSAIPLASLEQWYADRLRGFSVDVLGHHQGRKMLAFWRQP